MYQEDYSMGSFMKISDICVTTKEGYVAGECQSANLQFVDKGIYLGEILKEPIEGVTTPLYHIDELKYTDFNKGKYTGDSGRILGHILNPDASLRVLEILGTKEPLVELYWSQSRGEFPDNFVFTKDKSLISVGGGKGHPKLER